MPLALVIEDDSDVTALLCEALVASGYNIEAADDGLAAFARILRDPMPDIVITDIGLPGMDGNQLIRRIRSYKSLSNIPIVIITGSASNVPPTYYQALFHKPFDLMAVVTAVHELLDASLALPNIRFVG